MAVKKAKKGKSPVERVVVGSKVKMLIRHNGCMSSSEFIDALDAAVQAHITAACGRAQGNKRKTVKPVDL